MTNSVKHAPRQDGAKLRDLMNAIEQRAECARNPFRAVMEVWDGEKYRQMYAWHTQDPTDALDHLKVLTPDFEHPDEILRKARRLAGAARPR